MPALRAAAPPAGIESDQNVMLCGPPVTFVKRTVTFWSDSIPAGGAERDVVWSARHVRETHRRSGRDGDRAGLERGAGAAVTGHLHLDDWAGRRRGGAGRCRGRALHL